MTTEMHGVLGHDEFDVLLNDVLRTVANPELPERLRVNVQTHIWVREMKRPRPAAVFAPEVFLAAMSPRRDARSTATAVLLHAAAILLLFWLVKTHTQLLTPVKTAMVALVTPPPPMPVAKTTMGGGGGQKGPTPATKGHLPKFAETQITPPMKLEQPKVKMPAPTIQVQTNLKMANNNMPNIGMPNSPLVGMSLGNGAGSGLGSGNGSGLGPGSGGNYGGGLKTVGGGVSSPMVIYKVDPEFSEEARKAKFMGVVLVNLIVDAQGRPQNVHVLRGVGMGLDENAVAAVKQYRFKPAIENGKPVPVEMNVEVNFQIF